jgi:hypothetical protein
MTQRNWAGDDVSVAGASARAEFERRERQHQERVRRYRPSLLAGGAAGAILGVAAVLLNLPLMGLVALLTVLAVIVGVVALPDSTRSWATGAKGEALTGRALEQLKIEGFVILHDRRIPGSSANIDHIVIGPPGVAVVETKSYSGQLRVRGNDVYIRGNRRTSGTAEQARREAVAVTVALADELERRRLKVRPILCVHRASLPFFGAAPHGVSIVDGRGLVKLLRKAPRRLSAVDVHEIAQIADDRLRPAAAHFPRLYGQLPVPPRSDETEAPATASSFVTTDGDELFMPPARRAHLQLAREARARATDQRSYWTNKGLAQGKAPPTVPPKEADSSAATE